MLRRRLRLAGRCGRGVSILSGVGGVTFGGGGSACRSVAGPLPVAF
nr:MAG TPA: hypothetical protein [Caudoviricetes sp.]